MGSNRLGTMADVAASVDDGALVYLGGTVLDRKPMAAVRALLEAGRSDLDLVSFAGSVDVDLLVARGAARSVASAYVGLGATGRAPAFAVAAAEGRIIDREHTEWTLLGGLRAAAMGMPFLPTRAAVGSDIPRELGIRVVVDPYDGGEYLAVPAMRPDVALLHAWRVSADGFVQMAFPRDHLWDVDILAARASRRVVVTAEEVVTDADILTDPAATALLPVEVDLVAAAPRGAWPTSCRPAYEVDHAAIDRYGTTGDPDVLAAVAA